MKTDLKRINELAKKSRETGLTEEELAEQRALRSAYIAEFRKNLRSQLDHIELEYPDGRVVSLKEIRDEKYGKGEHDA
ncbi:MAG: DUF896 domain-containing protein [Lachnospiraceae bacterium]|nr:DUF896 domain-containing protein [Lachnospiraceae bacterium]MBP5254970.1 DUF896 domain-containing protein [Lachnospiraceae bacterium]